MSNPPNTAFKYNAPFEAQFDESQAQQFIIQSLIRQVHTCTLVKVLAVQPAASKVGFVTVQPLVQDVDTNDVVIAQSPIYNVPFFRLQGGASAIILDPEVGDIGLVIFAESDITHTKQTLKEGAAATARTHSSADGLYLGGVLNPAATQFVHFRSGAGGIEITSPNAVNLTTPGDVRFTAATVFFDANVVFLKNLASTKTGAGVNTFASTIEAPDAVIAGVTQSSHKHSGVMAGGDSTTGPQN